MVGEVVLDPEIGLSRGEAFTLRATHAYHQITSILVIISVFACLFAGKVLGLNNQVE